MGAFNWLLLDCACPACGRAVDLRIQTHIARSIDGDDRGMFHNRDYRLGEEMRWWPREHKKYQEWRLDEITGGPPSGEIDFELGIENCPSCGVELNMLIEFHGPRAVKVHWVRPSYESSSIGLGNAILVKAQCPGCKRDVTLQCLTEVAGDDIDDDRGRSDLPAYHLGETMRWWPRDHPDYATWRVNGRVGGPTEGEVDYECCFAVCPACRDQLYAVIEFQGPCPVALLQVGHRWRWPAEFRSDRLR